MLDKKYWGVNQCVKITQPVGDRYITNEQGKILYVRPESHRLFNSHNILVQFDKYIKGHDGYDGHKDSKDVKGKVGHCWWCDPLYLVTLPNKSEYKTEELLDALIDAKGDCTDIHKMLYCNICPVRKECHADPDKLDDIVLEAAKKLRKERSGKTKDKPMEREPDTLNNRFGLSPRMLEILSKSDGHMIENEMYTLNGATVFTPINEELRLGSKARGWFKCKVESRTANIRYKLSVISSGKIIERKSTDQIWGYGAPANVLLKFAEKDLEGFKIADDKHNNWHVSTVSCIHIEHTEVEIRIHNSIKWYKGMLHTYHPKPATFSVEVPFSDGPGYGNWDVAREDIKLYDTKRNKSKSEEHERKMVRLQERAKKMNKDIGLLSSLIEAKGYCNTIPELNCLNCPVKQHYCGGRRIIYGTDKVLIAAKKLLAEIDEEIGKIFLNPSDKMAISYAIHDIIHTRELVNTLNLLNKEEDNMFSICKHLDEIMTGVTGLKVIQKKKIRAQLEVNQEEINTRINSAFWEDKVFPDKDLVLKINQEIEDEVAGKVKKKKKD